MNLALKDTVNKLNAVRGGGEEYRTTFVTMSKNRVTSLTRIGAVLLEYTSSQWL